jgi:vacuolar-type H+-ATPase subunit E/Vma4
LKERAREQGRQQGQREAEDIRQQAQQKADRIREEATTTLESPAEGDALRLVLKGST